MAVSLIGVTSGALVGVFSLGLFVPRANSKVMQLTITYYELEETACQPLFGLQPQCMSVVDARIDFVESIIDSFDRGEEYFGAFVDLTKAFDSVSYKVLLNKLLNVGVGVRTHQWCRSYLEGRQQYFDNNLTNHKRIIFYKLC